MIRNKSLVFALHNKKRHQINIPEITKPKLCTGSLLFSWIYQDRIPPNQLFYMSEAKN